jgi:MFS family permease
LLRIALVIILGSFMSVLDTTIINVAMRELSRTFHVTLAVTQWVATGYSLALASTIPLADWASALIGASGQPAVAAAFGRTFLWAFFIVVVAFISALFLPRRPLPALE